MRYNECQIYINVDIFFFIYFIYNDFHTRPVVPRDSELQNKRQGFMRIFGGDNSKKKSFSLKWFG